jgi:hypothetical protein
MRGAWPGVEDEASITQTMASAEMLCRKYPDLLTDIASTPLVALRELLRKAWRAGDRREREWFVFRFRDLYRQTVMRVREVRSGGAAAMPFPVPVSACEILEATGSRSEPPQIDPIEAAAFYLQEQVSHTKYCKNQECPAPFYIATKKGQKYCEPECAKPRQKESKRDWWRKNRGAASKRNRPRKKSKRRC